MANQIIIDIGAVANDGTGDPLRTAFGYVNDNFSNVWATGVANSNVAFSGNRILTVNTNGNLVLAPNGTGKVQSNVDIVPNANNTLSLGSSTLKWNTVYTRNLEVDGNVTFDGNITMGADLTIDGNLTVNGTTTSINTTDVDIEDKIITIAYGSPNASVANSSGINVAGANANIIYNQSANAWTFNIGVSAVGNITAPYFIGNGSQLTGITSYSNANVSAYLASGSDTANIITTGNISAGNIIGTFVAPGFNQDIPFNRSGVLSTATGFNYNYAGNILYAPAAGFSGDLDTGTNGLFVGHSSYTNLGSDIVGQFSSNVNAYSQINSQNTSNGTAASGDYIITADNGNDTENFINLGIGSSNYNYPSYPAYRPNDGYLLINGGNLLINSQTPNKVVKVMVGGSANSDIIATVSNIGVDIKGNIIPTTSNTYSLGNSTNQWSDLYVSNATIYMNNVPISLTAGNVLTVNGADVVTTAANGESSIGNLNILGTVIEIAAGAPETLINISPDTEGWAFLQLPNDATANTANTRVVNAAGNVTIETGDFSTGGSNVSTWAFDNTGKLTAPGEVYGQYYTIRGGNGPGTDIGSLGYAGNIVDVYGVEGVRISTIDESGPFWQFDITGNLAIPGNIVANDTILIDNRESGVIADISIYSADNILLQGADRTNPGEPEGGDISILAGAGAADSGPGDASGGGDILIEGGSGGAANVYSGASGGFINITAGRGGDGSVANAAGVGGSIEISAGDGGSDNGNGGSSGGSISLLAGDSTDTTQDRGSITLISGNGGDETTAGGYVEINIPSVGTSPGGSWIFTNTGTVLETPNNAEIFNVNAGNLTVGSAGNTIVRTIGAGLTTYDWVFDPTGNLNLPTNGSINFNAGGITQATDEDFVITVNDADDDGFAIFNRITDTDGNVVGQTELRRDRLNINLDMLGSNYQWQFSDNQGIMYLPGNISGNYGSDTSFFVTDNGSGGTMEMKTISYIGDTLGSNVRVTQSNATISTSNAAYTWTFDNTGNLTVPGNTIVSTANATSGLGGKSISITAGASDTVTWNSNPGGNVNITGGYGSFGDGGGGPGGQVNIIGGGSSDSHAGNVTINTGGANTWTFDYTGNLTVPGSIIGTVAQATLANTVAVSSVLLNQEYVPALLVANTGNLGIKAADGTANITYNPSLNRLTVENIDANTVSLGNASTITTADYAIGYRDIPQVSFTGNTTISTTDAGKHFYSTQSTDYILTIANNASQGFQVGAAITIVNQGTGNITVAQGSGVALYLAGNATSGNRSVATFGMATLLKVSTDTWFINGTGVS